MAHVGAVRNKNNPKYIFYYGIPRVNNGSMVKRNALIAFVCLLLSSLLIYQFFSSFHKPVWSYDRMLDSTLAEQVKVSKAARALPLKGSLFCWVQTSPIYHSTRALAINETWIHRCDHGQLFTNADFDDERIPYSTVFKGIKDDYYNLFFKTRFAFKYIFDNISGDFDWYLKADDDTYIIVENLRKYLSTLDPNVPYYLGYTLKPSLKNGYNAGGAGYVLSRASLKIFAEQLYSDESRCPNNLYEDVGVGICMESAGIYPKDTRNEQGVHRFNTFSPKKVLGNLVDMEKWVKFQNEGELIARDLISFHELSPDDIRLFDILLYKVRTPV